MREIVTYGDRLVAILRRVDEAIHPIATVYVPRTADGRDEELTWNPPAFRPPYTRRFIPASQESPRATKGWDRSRRSV